MFQSLRRKCSLGLVIALQLIGISISQAQLETNRTVGLDPIFFQIEDPNSANTSGLTGTVMQVNPPGMGYCRFNVQFAIIGGAPLPTDTEIEFSLTLLSPYRSAPTTTLKTKIPAGSFNCSDLLLIPMPNPLQYFSFSTQVNGQFVPGLSSGRVYLPYQNNQTSVIVLTDSATIESMQAGKTYTVFGANRRIDQKTWHLRYKTADQQDQFYYSNRSEEVTYRVADYQQAPHDFFDWTTVTKIVIPEKLLTKLQPSFSDCLRQYVQHNGTLIVLGEKSLPETTKSIENWLFGSDANAGLNWKSEQQLNRKAVSVRVGLGRVAAIADSILLNDIDPQLLEALPQSRPAYNRQTGRVADQTNQTFWTWSLEQLGKPPVAAFSALIFMFVGIISPALLIYCLRSKRVALMMIVLPIVAIVGTTCLILYASIHDGFGTYSRVRSITLTDVAPDEGVCLSRQALFSGLQPSQGVRFNSDTEAWLIENRELNLQAYENSGTLEWTDSQQVFKGLIRSREQFQFSTLQPVKNIKLFEWTNNLSKDELQQTDITTRSLHVQSVADETIDLLVITTGSENCFYAKNIQPGQTAELSWIDLNGAIKLLLEKERTQPLALPPGLTPSKAVSSIEVMVGNYSASQYSPTGYEFDLDMIEAATVRLLNRDYLLKQPSYFVYLREGKYVDRAIEDADEQGSLHLIVGKWSLKK